MEAVKVERGGGEGGGWGGAIANLVEAVLRLVGLL